MLCYHSYPTTPLSVVISNNVAHYKMEIISPSSLGETLWPFTERAIPLSDSCRPMHASLLLSQKGLFAYLFANALATIIILLYD